LSVIRAWFVQPIPHAVVMRTALALGLVLVAWLRRRRNPDAAASEFGDPASTAEADQQAVLDMLIAQSSQRLESQLQDSDELATKALGVLAIDVSALAVLVTVRSDLHGSWLLAGGGLFLSGVLLLATIWPREFSTGPDPGEFYDEMGGSSRIEAARQMLAELIAALEQNDGPLRTKNRLFKLGFALLILSAFGSVVVMLAS
jgi:hypothetical protein